MKKSTPKKDPPASPKRDFQPPPTSLPQSPSKPQTTRVANARPPSRSASKTPLIQRSSSVLNSGYELEARMPSDVLHHPLGSFTEDSPPRPRDKRKRSPRSSPNARVAPHPGQQYADPSYQQLHGMPHPFYSSFNHGNWSSPMGDSPDRSGVPFRSPPSYPPERSPFRSPLPGQPRSSPMGSVYGDSFEMVQTPQGLEDTFSPLGASYEKDWTDHQLNFSRSESTDDEAGNTAEGSPFLRFVENMEGNDRSPPPDAKPSNVTSSPSTKQVLKSPVAPGPPPPSDTKPRRLLWPQGGGGLTDGTPSKNLGPALRLNLDNDGGIKSAQQSFHDINSLMRSQPSPMQRGGHPHYPSPYNVPPPHMYPHPHLHQHHIQPPLSHPPSRDSSARKPAPPRPRYAPPASVRKMPPSKATKEKENGKQNGKRVPCKCKKSKCLKLYCECFSHELFCEGCNCTDCRNLPAYENERAKAVKDARVKNPNAFKPRFIDIGATDRKGHTSGCRCKKSECLKKYCECFQAGVLCGGKCKCVNCMNLAGSQKLIDKRRRMKDTTGAEFAMRVAQEAWQNNRGQHGETNTLPSAQAANRIVQPSPTARRPTPSPPGPMHHPYMHPSYTIPNTAQLPMNYAGMGMHQMAYGADPRMYHGYPHQNQARRPHVASNKGKSSVKAKPAKRESSSPDKKPAGTMSVTKTKTPLGVKVTPGVTPKANTRLSLEKVPAVDSRPELPENSVAYFGDIVQPKSTGLAILSYLSKADVGACALVSKNLNKLATDEELWQLPQDK